MLGSFDYVCPTSLDDALRALADPERDRAVLAGGTDLLINIRNGTHVPSALVDIKRVTGLSRLEVSETTGVVHIGATVSLNTIAESPALARYYPGLTQAALSIATYTLRHRATLVGNLCNASPAADCAPILLVLDSVVHTIGPDGRRQIELANFFAGVKQTALRPGELVTDVHIPVHGAGIRTAFIKQQRIRGHDLAILNAAGAYNPTARTLRIALGSCAPTPLLLEPIEIDERSPGRIVEQILEHAITAVCPIDDVRASAAYRQAILPVVLRRLITGLLESKGGASCTRSD